MVDARMPAPSDPTGDGLRRPDDWHEEQALAEIDLLTELMIAVADQATDQARVDDVLGTHRLAS